MLIGIIAFIIVGAVLLLKNERWHHDQTIQRLNESNNQQKESNQ